MSDTSCILDLRKAGLLEAVLSLPYTFVMPNTLFEDELLGISLIDKQMLCDRGLALVFLPDDEVRTRMRRLAKLR